MYTEGHKVRGGKKPPLNLLDAIRELEKNKVLAAGLGEARRLGVHPPSCDSDDPVERQRDELQPYGAVARMLLRRT